MTSRIITFIASTGVGLSLYLAVGCGGGDSELSKKEEVASPPVLYALPDFTLTDQSGARSGLADLRGKVWIADFIFTRCGYTCPEQTAEKAKIQAQLVKGKSLAEVRLVTFTVDPEYDTSKVLAEYGRRHGADFDRWTFMTGPRGDLWNLSANGFKMAVAEDSKNAQMPILHSSRFALVDGQGRVRGFYDGLNEDGRTKLMTDLGQVVAEEPATSGKQVSYKKFPYPKEIVDPPWLKSRGELQQASAGSIKAFHDFKFSDKVGESGITFQNRIVDDAGKYHKAVHYDHGNGVAVADVNGDGLLDLYFTTQIGSNELWKNLGAGKFSNISTPALALGDKISVAASFADTDNDGDQDLFVTTVRGGNHFYENNGNGVFTDKTEVAGLGHVGHSSGGVFFDYDKDGLLDLFVCNVGVYTGEERGKGGYCIGVSDAFRGHLKPDERNEQSILYHNTGGNRFVDVSKEMGLVDMSWTGDAAPFDYNGDGWTDLYVLSMQGHDQLYENVAGKAFVNKSSEVFPKTPWGSMGIQVFDFDNDGNMDVFLTDMHSDMSEDVGPNREKLKAAMKWDETMLQSGGKSIYGNGFFRGTGGGKFEEVSDQIGAENYWPWGLSQGDLNADGFVDVFIASSMNFPFRYAVNSVLLNDGGQRFVDSEFILGVEPRRGGRTAKPWFKLDPKGEDKEHALVSEHNLTEPVEVWGALGTRSSAIVDIDQDGDLDIVTNEFHDGPMVLVSDLADKKPIHWLKIRLRGTKSNRNGLGSVVRVVSGAKSYLKVMDGATGYLSHGVQPLYFGLDDSSSVQTIEVTWPSGEKQTITDPAVNGVIEIVEGR